MTASASAVARLPMPEARGEVRFSTFLRLAWVVRNWWPHLLLGFVAGLFSRFSLVALLIIGALLIGQVAAGATTEQLGTYIIASAAAVVVRGIATWIEMYLVHLAAYGMLAELRGNAYAALEPRAPAYTMTRRTGDLVAMIMADVETIELFFAHTLVPIALAVTVPLVLLVGLGTMSLWLPLVLLPFLVAVVAIPFAARPLRERLGTAVREQQALVNSHLVDSIQGLRELLSFGRGAARAAEVQQLSEHLAWQAQIPNSRVSGGLSAVLDPLIVLGALASLGTAAHLAAGGSIARVEVALAVVMSIGSFIPLLELGGVRRNLNQVAASARRYFAVVDEPIRVQERTRRSPGAVAPSIAFEGVAFAYEREGPRVLEGVSFDVQPGETVALVGPSGAGKSTCVSLLLRFWDPDQGAIRLGGIDLRDFLLDDLRGRIAVVQQDSYLFNMSLRDNIRLSRPDARQSKVEDAAKRANLHGFILGLPDGYDTVIGERGVKLSGGQRQRVALARAFLKDAPILILDEAMSNLDSENERLIRDAVSRLMAGRTTLVIAHRLSSIVSADRVVMLDVGRVVATGRHRELIDAAGPYAQLLAAQLHPGRVS